MTGKDEFAIDLAPSIRGHAERLYCERRQRQQHFEIDAFWEPGWDLLLYLFSAYEEGRATVPLANASRACVAFSSQSAARWINLLIAKGYVAAVIASTPPLTARLGITAKGRASMERYLLASIACSEVP